MRFRHTTGWGIHYNVRSALRKPVPHSSIVTPLEVYWLPAIDTPIVYP